MQPPQWLGEDGLAQAREWLRRELHTLGIAPIGDATVTRSTSISCILRQPTAMGAVVLKAVPPLFRAEPALLQLLERVAPGATPTVVAAGLDRGWVVLREVDGVALADAPRLEDWVAAVQALARLQLASLDCLGDLAACGCAERPILELPAQLAHVCSRVVPIATANGHALTPSEIAALRALQDPLLRDARALAALPVPVTLVHGDFHANNIMVTSGNSHPVILDWTDGALSHPFFDLLTFYRSDAAAVRWDGASLTGITDGYLAMWTDAGVAPADDVREAYRTAQRLAPLYHAISYGNILEIDEAAAARFAVSVPWFLRVLLGAYRV